jgi:hypothetical protein
VRGTGSGTTLGIGASSAITRRPASRMALGQ